MIYRISGFPEFLSTRYKKKRKWVVCVEMGHILPCSYGENGPGYFSTGKFYFHAWHVLAQKGK